MTAARTGFQAGNLCSSRSALGELRSLPDFRNEASSPHDLAFNAVSFFQSAQRRS